MVEQVVQLGVTLFLLVLSLDLLYLFHKGVWYDPNKQIEKAEVISLCVLSGGCVANSIRLLCVLLGG